ncbi:MAG: DUF4835 family protein [Bacteroidota bacterium]
MNYQPFTMNIRIKALFLPISFAILALFIPPQLTAQELDCDVTVNAESIPTTNREFLTDFAREVKTYINSYRWTTEDLEGEKIKCSISIFFLSASGPTRYSAQIFVGSQRLIYEGDGKMTAVVRILDDKWDFVYERNQALYHNENRFDPLASLLDFYAYVIIGFDFDSHESLSGTPYFQKGSNIVNLSVSAAFSRGWTKTTATYSRAGLIEELLNSRYGSLREGLYQYHFNGLDVLATDRKQGLETVISVLDQFASFRKTEGTNVLFIRIFFDAKHLELADLFTDYSDPEIYTKLNTIDPSHQRYYDEYRNKRK